MLCYFNSIVIIMAQKLLKAFKKPMKRRHLVNKHAEDGFKSFRMENLASRMTYEKVDQLILILILTYWRLYLQIIIWYQIENRSPNLV